MFHPIHTPEDIQTFLEATNELHDGYIVSVQYTHSGISKIESGHYYFEPDKTKLTLRILVTSIWDATVEIEFEGLFAWQIRNDERDDILATTLCLHGDTIVWTDDPYTDAQDMKKSSYVIASSMKWRFIE